MEDKLDKILDAVKVEIEDTDNFEKDIDAILSMFDTLKEVPVENIQSFSGKRTIHLNELREDIAVDQQFRKEMRGSYFKVPNVSKK